MKVGCERLTIYFERIPKTRLTSFDVVQVFEQVDVDLEQVLVELGVELVGHVCHENDEEETRVHSDQFVQKIHLKDKRTVVERASLEFVQKRSPLLPSGS